MLYSSQFNLKIQHGLLGRLFLNYLKNEIRLVSSEFSLKRKHGSKQLVYF